MDYKPHLYRTNKDDMVIIANEQFPDLDNSEQTKAYDENRLVTVSIYGSFPYENELQDLGTIEIDKPISDWNNLEEVGNLVDVKLKEYVGEMYIEEFTEQIPQVEKMWHIAGYHDFDIEIRNPWSEYVAYNHGTVATISIPEVLEELEQEPDRFDYEEVIESITQEIGYSVWDKYTDWQKEIIKNELDDALYDFEQEHERLVKKDIER